MTGLAVSRTELLEGLVNVGLRPGDVVYVASSLAALGFMDDPVADVTWALREAVGDDGTLVMPAFHFGFCKGAPFDVRRTPSACGALSEAQRTSRDAVRTSSPPFHTVTAVGRRAAEIGRIESQTSFGRDSVFQHLHDIGAKHLLIGCGFNEGVAHFHWLEELHEVPYRYWKKFEGPIIDGERQWRRSFFMFARRLDGDVELDADPLGQQFEDAGGVRVTTVGLCRIRAFDLCDFAAFAGPRFAADPLVILKPASRARWNRPGSPVKAVDHIAIVSHHSDRIREFLRLLPCDLTHEGEVTELGVRCQYFSGLNTRIEFVDPVAAESCVDGFLRRRPVSPLHHLALEVTDMDVALRFFASKGYTPLDSKFYVDPKPGRRVTFLSPALTGGLLVELVCNDAHVAVEDRIHG